MNVLYVGGFKLPDKNAAAHRVLANAKILRDLGSKVYLLGQTDDIHLASNHLIKEECKEKDIFMFSQAYPKGILEWFNYIIDVGTIKKCIKMYNVDCIILYNYPSFATYRLLPFLKKNNIKVYADCTEWYGKSTGNIIKRLIKDFDTVFRMKWINFKLDGVICISSYLQKYYKSSRTLLLPPLVDLEEKKWMDITNVNINSLEPITFIYAGQIGGHKDQLDEIIDILIDLKLKFNLNFNLKLVGITKEDYLKNICNRKIDPSLIFYGRLSHTDTLKEVKSSDFVLFFREINRVNMAGFPTKFVEAVTCGVPVITNKTSDLNDYLINDYNGYFLEGSNENIFNILKNILELDRLKISELKSNTKQNNPFKYRLYYKQFKEFLH